MEGLLNLITIKNLNTCDFWANHIKDDHSYLRVEFYIAVAGPVASFWARFSVKGCAKIITATTTLNNAQFTYLSRERRLVCFQQKLL